MNDAATHRTVGGHDGAVAPRHLAPLDRDEALRLLGTVSLGRIVFSQQALPAVRPVNHLMDGEDIVVRLHDGASLASIVAPTDATGVVVAYEADVIDPVTHLGWSVVVTGYARLVTDERDLARYAAALRPWAQHDAMNAALRIRPDLVTGSRLIAEPAHPAPRTERTVDDS
ncbi:pyridoxamine 5'-phosphate oxidase family protein [Streptomyces ficellus]|uniref:Pyridoxamine 5'-phosphate oxidase family protein n=1 Tax=Streptomyces ficellus TaxID=1977088 RepID=A0A6I6F162_9ACTN|nr:pyridoxamine 5'-phosphate oxidase family protein [Streptomyces ficellus]QGV77370.1 pyridoxamine 5'-phosphate oxidase family protein [Streptomyces ficellus]